MVLREASISSVVPPLEHVKHAKGQSGARVCRPLQPDRGAPLHDERVVAPTSLLCPRRSEFGTIVSLCSWKELSLVSPAMQGSVARFVFLGCCLSLCIQTVTLQELP